MARRLILSLSALLAALSLGGCSTQAFCQERSLLGFLFCDPALVEAEPPGPDTHIRRLSPRDGLHVKEPLVDQDVLFTSDTVGANDPLYPAGYIAREEWDMDGNGTYERSYPYGRSSFLYAFTEKGPHTVRLRVTDRENNVAERQDTFTVKVNQDSPRNRPRAALTMSNQTPRVGEEVTLSAMGSSDPDGRIVDYEWHLWTDVIHTTEPVLKYTFQEPRENNALLKVTDDDGLYDEALVPYRVGDEGQNGPLAGMTIEPNPAKVGDRVVFKSTSSDPGGRIVRWEWDLDGDEEYELDSTEPIEPERVFDVAGTYPIRLRVTDNDGQWNHAFEQLVVQEREHCDPCTAAPGGFGKPFSPFAGTAQTAASNRFFARLAVGKVSTRDTRGRRSRRSRTLRGVGAAGNLRGSIVGPPGQPAPPAPKALAGFLRSRWAGKLDLTALASGHRHRATALILATPRRRSAGRVCVRVRFDVRPGKPGRGSFQVLGGTGPAARLRAKGRFGFDLRPKGNAVLAGTIASDKGRARSLPRACRSLR